MNDIDYIEAATRVHEVFGDDAFDILTAIRERAYWSGHRNALYEVQQALNDLA